MRTPKRRREQIRKVSVPAQTIDLTVVASGVKYVGSPEHKDTPSFAGRLRPRANAAICDPQFVGRQDELTELIRANILAGNVGGLWEGGFPRFVWCRYGEDIYEARLTNQGNGEYKGFKLEPGEEPEGLK